MDQMPGFENLERSLKNIPSQLPIRPKAVLVMSGHWEENDFTVMSNPRPKMLYDFGGFPEFTYKIQYPAPGHPELAAEVQKLIRGAGINANSDPERGFDHGTYSTLYPMYPKADVPVVQLSVRSDYDPEIHIRVGRALAPLREQGVLIIGSGSSYHNLRLPKDRIEQSRSFDRWLQDKILSMTGKERNADLIGWEQAPAARSAHPQEDHLMPLMFAVGAAENEAASLIYHEMLINFFFVSSFKLGQEKGGNFTADER